MRLWHWQTCTPHLQPKVRFPNQILFSILYTWVDLHGRMNVSCCLSSLSIEFISWPWQSFFSRSCPWLSTIWHPALSQRVKKAVGIRRKATFSHRQWLKPNTWFTFPSVFGIYFKYYLLFYINFLWHLHYYGETAGVRSLFLSAVTASHGAPWAGQYERSTS